MKRYQRALASWQEAKGFTLIETLLVVTIVLIMLGAVVPAFKSFGQSYARRGSVALVMSGLDNARALAVAQGRATYVVFADQTMDEKHRCRAWAVFQEDSAFMPKLISGWNLLAGGTSLRPVKDSVLDPLADPPFPRRDFNFGGTVRKLPYIKFAPTGEVEEPTSPKALSLFVFKGLVSATGAITYTDADRCPDAITLSMFTGRASFKEGTP